MEMPEIPGMVDVTAEFAEPSEQEQAEQQEVDLLEQYQHRRFDPAIKIERPEPVLTLGDKPICTRGDISAITGKAGVAKSRFLSAALARLIASPDNDGDFLHWKGTNLDGQAVSYIDCEQSPYDFQRLMNGVLWRAGVRECPPWMYAYRAAGLQPGDMIALIKTWLERAHKNHGVRLIVIDGLADLVSSVNDETACTGLISTMMSWAADYDCAIMGVIHANQGSLDANARGHLGKHAERKGSACVELKRAGDDIEISTPIKFRNGPLDSLAIKWDDEAKDFRCTKSKGDRKASEAEEKKQRLASDVFKAAGKQTLSYGEAVDSLMQVTGTKIDNSKKTLAKLRDEGYVKINIEGRYCLAEIRAEV